MTLTITIGQAIRKARGKMLLRELADKTGFSVTYLSDIQTGRTQPSVKSLFKIAAALDVRPGMLLDAVYDPEIFDRDTFAKKILAMYDAAKGTK